jgi:alpha-maltose-1-phosphate synthase
MQVLVVHPGVQHSHHLAAQLNRLGRLAGFHTGLALTNDSLGARCLDMLPARIGRHIANRRLEGVPSSKIHLYPITELSALFELHRRREPERVVHSRNKHFQNAIPRLAIEKAAAVIGFDTSSWILAERCREAAIPILLDQSIGHPDSKIQIFSQIRNEFPEWSEGVGPRLRELREAEQIEHDSVDAVVAASSFTVRTLVENGVAREKIRLNPYGVDATRFKANQPSGNRPMRFVFVGTINARKGVPLLLEAWRRLKPKSAELWLVGPVATHLRALVSKLSGVRVFGGLPHFDIPAVLKQCDVFVFPSYFEGFGLVILEAMACGLPIITTTATAGPDIYQNNQGGWIVPVGDIEALALSIDRCLSDPIAVRDMGRVARRIAEQHTWASYGERWIEILDSVCPAQQ